MKSGDAAATRATATATARPRKTDTPGAAGAVGAVDGGSKIRANTATTGDRAVSLATAGQKEPLSTSFFLVAGNLPRPKKNTENFDPSHDPPEMRILCAREGLSKYDRPCSTRDVIVVHGLFCEPDDYVRSVCFTSSLADL